MPTCPNCEANLDELNYSADIRGREWGHIGFPLSDRNYEICETDIGERDNVIIICPECEYEFTQLQRTELDRQWRTERERMIERQRQTQPITQEREQTFTPIWNPHYTTTERPDGEGNGMRYQSNHQRFNPEGTNSRDIQECPKCSHIFRDNPSIEQICPRCDNIWDNESRPRQQAPQTRAGITPNMPRGIWQILSI